ncbi:MAG: hypothetical protein IPN01_13885 [Deltaproteobacteria bacterium]|nr:hypothetical protein [Deltaproteobacteria bacterium]
MSAAKASSLVVIIAPRERGDVFGEAEGVVRGVAKRADAAASVAGAAGLGDVLDHLDPVAVGDAEDRLHVAGRAEEVRRHHGFGAGGDGALKGLGVEHMGGAADVGEDGLDPQRFGEGGDGEVGQRREDHLVAGLEAPALEQEREAEAR